MSEQICSTIVGNLESLDRELDALRDEADRLKKTRNDLLRQIGDLISGSGTGESGHPRHTSPKLGGGGGRLGRALELVVAVGQATAGDNAGTMRRLETHRDQIDVRLQEIDRQIAQKRQVLRELQRSYSQNNCFDLGFSHEVLNIRSADSEMRI